MKIVLGSLSEGRREIFSKYFKDSPFTDAKIPVISNITAPPIKKSQEI